jgi:two-component system, LuxR family, sensor kinase FixL
MTAAADWAKRVLENALDAIFTIDAEGRVVQLNAAAESLFGLRRAEAIGRPLADLIIPPEYRERHRAGLARVAAGGEPRILDRRVELEALRRGGERFPVELIVTRTGDRLFTGFVRDLTELREAERRRTELQRLLIASEQLAGMGSWGLELPSLEAVWSDGMHAIHGTEPGAPEPGIDALLERTHPADRAAVAAVLADVVERPETVPAAGVALEYRIVRPDGSVRDVHAHGRVERGDDGRPARWVGSARDVTDER